MNGRKRNYAFACMGLLQKSLYSNVKVVNVYQGRTRKERDIGGGRFLVVRVMNKLKREEVGLFTIYQHTADQREKQQFIWDQTAAFLKTETMKGIKWVATVDMNATVGQLRWDYGESGKFGATDRAMEEWGAES